MHRGDKEIIIVDVFDDYGRKVAQELRGTIIRCKDCKWSEEVCGDLLCRNWAIGAVAKDGYCYKGERRGDTHE